MLSKIVMSLLSQLHEVDVKGVARTLTATRARVITNTHEYAIVLTQRTGMLRITINELRPGGEQVFVTQMVTNVHQIDYILAMISDGFASMFPDNPDLD
jgi:hypothetical protein